MSDPTESDRILRQSAINENLRAGVGKPIRKMLEEKDCEIAWAKSIAKQNADTAESLFAKIQKMDQLVAELCAKLDRVWCVIARLDLEHDEYYDPKTKETHCAADCRLCQLERLKNT